MDPLLNVEAISIPRWTIKRDTRSTKCGFCGSAIVCVTTENRQMVFCGCRLVEYRLLPRIAHHPAHRAKE